MYCADLRLNEWTFTGRVGGWEGGRRAAGICFLYVDKRKGGMGGRRSNHMVQSAGREGKRAREPESQQATHVQMSTQLLKQSSWDRCSLAPLPLA